MKTTVVRLLVLLLLLLGITPASENKTQRSISVGNVELSSGMRRNAVIAALRAKNNYLVTKMRDSRWVVSDKEAMHAVAILTFDRDGKLQRIQKNWTPEPDRAIAFAQALYQLAEQMPSDDPGGGSRTCTLSLSRRFPVGPYAWLRDPGQPDLDVREIDLTCGKETIQIYINEPTDATRAINHLHIERVLLYESISGP